MKKPDILFDNLNLSGIPDDIIKDKLWLRCMEWALQSRSKDQRYGALVILNGEIIGEGRNRRRGEKEKFPFKSSYFIHAEQSAVADAIKNRGEEGIDGATVYVAGILVPDKRPLVRKDSRRGSSCRVCTPLYPKYNLSIAFISALGWITYSGVDAFQNALDNGKHMKDKNMKIRDFRKSVSL